MTNQTYKSTQHIPPLVNCKFNSKGIYRRAAAKARTAPSPVMATAFRPAALPVGDADGSDDEVPLGEPVVTVELDDGVDGEVVVVVAFGATYTEETTTAVEVVRVDEETYAAVVVVMTAAEVVEAPAADEAVAAALEAVADGMTKETPAEAQRPVAAWIVFAKSAAEQAFSTHGVRAEMKPDALQIHAMSVVPQPELPMEEMAQDRAHCGMSAS